MGILVEPRGLEPLTFSLPARRSPVVVTYTAPIMLQAVGVKQQTMPSQRARHQHQPERAGTSRASDSYRRRDKPQKPVQCQPERQPQASDHKAETRTAAEPCGKTFVLFIGYSVMRQHFAILRGIRQAYPFSLGSTHRINEPADTEFESYLNLVAEDTNTADNPFCCDTPPSA